MTWLLAAVVGVVFVFAGVQKMTSWSTWTSDAAAQRVPSSIAVLVPVVEVVLGVTLIALRPTKVAIVIACAVLLAFTAHLVARIRRGDDIPCGCFGSTRRVPPSWSDVWRNVALMVCLMVSLGG